MVSLCIEALLAVLHSLLFQLANYKKFHTAIIISDFDVNVIILFLQEPEGIYPATLKIHSLVEDN